MLLYIRRLAFLGEHVGYGSKQITGVRVLRGAENGISCAVFYDFSALHDGDVVRDVVDHREVMGDEEHADAHIMRELGEEVEDLALDGDIERGDRLIRQEKCGAWSNGACNGDALALAAGELVRVFEHVLRAEANALHKLGNGVFLFFAGELGAGTEGLCQGAEDAHARIEGGVRVLEDHLEVRTAFPDFARGECGKVGAVEDDTAGGEGLQLHDGSGERGFATAGLTDQTENAAFFQAEAHIVHRADDIAGGSPSITYGVMNASVQNLQVRHVGILSESRAEVKKTKTRLSRCSDVLS